MDGRMFTKEIIGKRVVTVTGHDVGTLEDLVIDTDRGIVKYLLISGSGSVISSAMKLDDRGRMVVETERIRIDADKIVIN